MGDDRRSAVLAWDSIPESAKRELGVGRFESTRDRIASGQVEACAAAPCGCGHLFIWRSSSASSAVQIARDFPQHSGSFYETRIWEPEGAAPAPCSWVLCWSPCDGRRCASRLAFEKAVEQLYPRALQLQPVAAVTRIGPL